jgi:hypothetical protein
VCLSARLMNTNAMQSNLQTWKMKFFAILLQKLSENYSYVIRTGCYQVTMVSAVCYHPMLPFPKGIKRGTNIFGIDKAVSCIKSCKDGKCTSIFGNQFQIFG